jgi:hypothetical protein
MRRRRTKSVLIIPCFILFLVLFSFQVCEATLVDAWHTFHTRINASDSLTCFEWRIPDPILTGGYDTTALVFLDAEFTEFTGDQDITGWDWHSVVPEGSKNIYYSGPMITNDSVDWVAFKYQIRFQWETEDVIDAPAYVDAALYREGFGTAADWIGGFKGTPGVIGSFEGEDDGVEPFAPEEDFINPAPEPMTLVFLGIGGLFLLRWRKTHE